MRVRLIEPGSGCAVHRAAGELGRTLAEHGHGLVFGGYDVGLMGAVAHGVGDAGGSAS